jgi:glycosyltransferase involved in cell wall biosynthesis
MGRFSSFCHLYENVKLKIGFVIYGSLDNLSGGYLYDRNLVNYLRSKGDEVTIISMEHKKYIHNLQDNWSREIKDKFEDLDIDLMIQDELNHPSLAFLNNALDRKYPIISIVHHLKSSEEAHPFSRVLSRYLEGKYLKSLDGYIFNSETTKSAVKNLQGDLYPSVIAKPGGDRFLKYSQSISEEDRHIRSESNRPLEILFIGNVIPRKQLNLLIDALNEIDIERWNLNVIGNTTVDEIYMKKIVNQISKLKLTSKVKILGTLTDVEVAEYLKRSHTLVVPSSWEGFGIVYLEAMSFGLPVIACNQGAAHEIITSGSDGFLVGINDYHAIADHINSLMKDKKLLMDMSRLALKTYNNHLTWEESASLTREFLLEFIELYHD